MPSTPIWATAIICFILLSLPAGMAMAAAKHRDVSTHFFQDTFGNFAEELDNAKQQGKDGILLFFEEDECPFCAWMKHKVLNRPEVQDWYREHFLLFSVDIRGDNEVVDFDGSAKSSKEFSRRYNRRELTPVIGFFGLEGKELYTQPGVVRTVEEFLWLGEFVVDGHYKRTNFIRFKAEKRKAGEPAGAPSK